MRTRILAMACLLAAPLAAQMPGMFPWWDSPIAKDLNLTDEQHAKIRDITRESRATLIQQRAALETAEGDLGDVMDSDPYDASKAGSAMEKVLSARADLSRTVSIMSLKLRQVLTTEQWRELQKRQPRMPGMRGEGRRGGPPGGGGAPFDRPRRPDRENKQ